MCVRWSLGPLRFPLYQGGLGPRCQISQQTNLFLDRFDVGCMHQRQWRNWSLDRLMELLLCRFVHIFLLRAFLISSRLSLLSFSCPFLQSRYSAVCSRGNIALKLYLSILICIQKKADIIGFLL